MANWSDLKAAVAQVIKTNGNNEITGQILQDTLNSIISNVGANATFAGIATPTTNPGAPDGNVFYFATQAGTYTNFGGVELNEGLNILRWNGTSWAVTNVMTIVQGIGNSENVVMSQKAVTSIIGLDNYEEFSTSKSYSAGDVVNYNGKLYKFTAAHAAGAWTGADVEETDAFNEIENCFLVKWLYNSKQYSASCSIGNTLLYIPSLTKTSDGRQYQEYNFRIDNLIKDASLNFSFGRIGNSSVDLGGLFFYGEDGSLVASGRVYTSKPLTIKIPSNASYVIASIFLNRAEDLPEGNKITFTDILLQIQTAAERQRDKFILQSPTLVCKENPNMSIDVTLQSVNKATGQFAYFFEFGMSDNYAYLGSNTERKTFNIPRLSCLYYDVEAKTLEVSSNLFENKIMLLHNISGAIDRLEGQIAWMAKNTENVSQAVSQAISKSNVVSLSAYAFGALKMISRLGAPGTAPEMSLDRYYQAYDKGYRMMLADVRMTKDKVFVGLHNDTINSMARDSNNTPPTEQLYISNLTISECDQWSFTGGNFSYNGLKILRIENFLKMCKSRSITPVLELKDIIDGTDADNLMNMIKLYGLDKNIIIHPANDTIGTYPQAAAWAQRLPGVPILTVGTTNQDVIKSVIDKLGEITAEHGNPIYHGIGVYQQQPEKIKDLITTNRAYAKSKNVGFWLTNTSDFETYRDIIYLIDYISADTNVYEWLDTQFVQRL